MDPRELEKLLKVCRKYGVKAIKTASIELQIDTDPSTAPSPSQAAPEASSQQAEASLTDEDVLLWSASQ